jgi:hypothetical protein
MIIKILKNRINKEILKLYHKLYRNLWFIVKKKDKKYRLINHAAELNKHIIRDANMPLNINTFLKKFVRCAITFFINFFSDYDHVKLDSKYKNIIIFIIPLGLLRQTIIL